MLDVVNPHTGLTSSNPRLFKETFSALGMICVQPAWRWSHEVIIHIKFIICVAVVFKGVVNPVLESQWECLPILNIQKEPQDHRGKS